MKDEISCAIMIKWVAENPFGKRILKHNSKNILLGGFSMLKTVKDVQEFCKNNDIKMIDFKMVDIDGRWRHLTIPYERFNDNTMKYGIGLRQLKKVTWCLFQTSVPQKSIHLCL